MSDNYYNDGFDLNTIDYGDSDDDLKKRRFDPAEYNICSIKDSLAVCLNTCKVNIHYMAWLSGSTEDEVLAVHKGVTIFQKPEIFARTNDPYEGWVLEPQYIKGNLKHLLKVAAFYNDMYHGRFDVNETHIKSRMPEPPTFDQIYSRIGASWIYISVIKDFVAWLMRMKYKPDITKTEGKWHIRYNYQPLEVLETVTYGTLRMPFKKLLECILDAVTVKVRDEIEDPFSPSGKRYVENVYETTAAQNKADLIIDKFQEFLRLYPHLMERLVNAYSEVYCYAVPKYNGDFLTLSDMNKSVTPYKHQKDAAARIIFSNNTLLCHDVGTGKTYCYVIAVHELYRMKISRKNMVVCPNTTFKGTVEAHRTLYPQDKILEISPDDFTPSDREKTIRKIKEENYVAIYICYSKFDMLGMSKHYHEDKYNKQIKEYRHASNMASDVWEKVTLDSKAGKLKKQRDSFLNKYKEDECNCFDELGITTLVIDECQNYKNFGIESRLENVVGMRNKSSKKAEKLMDKVRYIQSKDGRIVFATGTLLTNSIADLFVFQKYLQPETMEACNISNFGEWANTFGSITTNFEIDVNSQNYRYKSRISHFHNLPELMAVVSEFCDFYHTDSSDMKLPIFNGYKVIVVPNTPYHEDFNKEIVQRTEDIRKGHSSAKEDNVLKLITDGRKAGIDIRLIYPLAVIEESECKAGRCAIEVAKLYREYPGTSQIIFCDYSTPKDGFNVYDETKKYLVKNGIPEKKIAFIHDGTTEAKKNKLLKDLDSGKLAVMIGSTQKLGVGVNVQKHLIAIHHLDAPWRPADLTQREGRLIRQGNLNKEVFQYRYITEKSFDAYVWQILENKQSFISSFLAGSLSEFHRDESEIDAVTLDLAEVKALAIGNPMIKDRIVTKNKLERARISQKQRYQQLYQLKTELKDIPEKIKQCEKTIAVIKSDREYYKEHKEKLQKEERQAFGEDLIESLKHNHLTVRDRLFDTYMGFEVILPKDMTNEDKYVMVRRKGGGAYRVDMNDKTPKSCTQALDGTFAGFTNRLSKWNKALDKLLQQKSEVTKEIAKGNEYDEEVELLRRRVEEIDKELERIAKEKEEAK